MKAGKTLEQFVCAIQKCQKNSSDTLIGSNVKLLDHTGIKREIDVFVRTKIQGENIGIAFECKDYKKKVGVNVVEAFYSKCNDIPEIHKGIIVSPCGFTVGAKKKAQFYGIGLYQIGDVPLGEVLKTIDIFYTQCWVEMASHFRSILEHYVAPEQFPETGFFCFSDNKEVNMEHYLTVILQNNIPSMIPSIHNYMHSKSINIGNIPLTITPPDKLYVVDKQGGKHLIKELFVSIRVSMKTELQNITKQSLFINTLKKTPSVRISEFNREDGIIFILVQSNNKYNAFMKDKEGCYKEIGLVHFMSKQH